jgi:large subunit ribosomal protein L25
MQAIALNAKSRTITGKPTKTLRLTQLIPGVVYGNAMKPENVQMEYNIFAKVFLAAGATNIIDLTIDEKAPLKVLIHDLSRHPVTHRISHVDFYALNMNEKITVTVPLKFVGDSAAVKELAGILVKTIDEVEVSALPTDLVSDIEVNLSPLKTFADALFIHDIVLPKGITLTTKTDDVIAKVMPPRSDEELKSLGDAVVENLDTVEKVAKPEKAKDGEDATPEKK